MTIKLHSVTEEFPLLRFAFFKSIRELSVDVVPFQDIVFLTHSENNGSMEKATTIISDIHSPTATSSYCLLTKTTMRLQNLHRSTA